MMIRTRSFRSLFSILNRRNISSSSRVEKPRGYEGDGKTTIHILNRDEESGLMIDGFSQIGFRLNNDITVLGSMVIFPRSVLSWKIDEISQLTEESFSIFEILEPKIDILVLGVGDKIENYNFYRNILPFSRKCKIPFEILATEQACSTFNFLNSEGRNVAGAMIPPKHFQVTDDDELRTKLRYQNLYETEWAAI